jgi:hypothetical protein
MIPSLDDLADAQNAINRQKPALSVIPEGKTALFELTSRQASTIAVALGVTSGAVRGEAQWAMTSPTQTAWAAIIDVALQARGAAGDALRSEGFAALTRVDAPTLERMACLVLAHASAPTVRATTSLETGKLTIEIGAAGDAPDTPETVAAKCIAARAVADAFRDGQHPTATFTPEVEPKGGARR